MKAVIKYIGKDSTEKEKIVDDFKSTYSYDTYFTVKGIDEDGLEVNMNFPTDKLISISIAK